ncbi:MAG: lipocalin family protein [Alistipes senegalensis]|nr:lipocalin family protein [Bacteroides cellulosilyticus]MCM1352479.1 lipocalin family protein [Alistipes senegalensis]
MKKLFFCTAALLAAISFSACSDDDETNLPITPDAIAGTWQITNEKGWCIYDDEEEGSGKETWNEKYPDEEGFYWTCTFDKNGSCVKHHYEPFYSTYYTYSISDTKLTMTNTEYQESETFEIKKLTESQLVLVSTYEGESELEENTQTYKRIE